MTKKKVFLIAIAVILAAAIAFCLIYTRPRTLDSILNGREITSISAIAIEGNVANGRAYQDTWKLEAEMVDEQVMADLLELMGSCKYRASLRTLLHPSSTEIHGKHTVYLAAVLDDGTLLSIDYLGLNVIFDPDPYAVTTATDKAISETLSSYIRQIGVKQ